MCVCFENDFVNSFNIFDLKPISWKLLFYSCFHVNTFLSLKSVSVSVKTEKWTCQRTWVCQRSAWSNIYRDKIVKFGWQILTSLALIKVHLKFFFIFTGGIFTLFHPFSMIMPKYRKKCSDVFSKSDFKKHTCYQHKCT